MVALGEINITRGCDGATPHIETFLYAPCPEGKTVEIVMTKPNREGSGADPYQILTLQAERVFLVTTLVGSDGSLPNESFSYLHPNIQSLLH